MYATIADKNSEENSSNINNSLSVVAIACVKPTLNIERGWFIHVLSYIFFYSVIIWTPVVGRSRLTFSVRISMFDYQISREPIELKKLSQSIHMLFAGRKVRIGKNCARGLEYGPRPQANGRTHDRGHSFSQYGPT